MALVSRPFLSLMVMIITPKAINPNTEPARASGHLDEAASPRDGGAG